MSNLKQKRFVDTDYFHEQLDSTTVEVEGSHISATETKIGYMTDIEILGNTIQNEEDLADIRSVGDKVEGQELYEIPVLSRGKNLFDGKLEQGAYNNQGIKTTTASNYALRSVNKINVSPNTTYVFSVEEYSSYLYVCQYHNDTFIKQSSVGASRIITTTENTNYITFNTNNNGSTLPTISNIQLEEGTQTTPYEPYQEDKLTILSPTPLEKVGDVADRIIEKDGVWGVEKNISRELIDTKDSWIQLILDDVIMFGTSSKYKIPEWFGISNYFIYENSDSNNEHFKYDINTSKIYTYIKKSKLSTQDVAGFEKWSTENGYYHIFPTTQPQFIPLPHSQQIKLRTFANKTNISFGCEIEGTIKAQVPKSLGATVNTHTEQINNLNKELDRVKKLEESTVSTVTTESDFTTVEATSNGYFEDVKLEGKTLATVLTCSTNKNYAKWTPVDCVSYKAVEAGKVYTIIAQTNNTAHCGLKNRTSADYLLALAAAEEFICKTITFSKSEELVIVTDTEGIVNMELMILEGDHTQNPPSYFEGLKSVGEDTDEIVVSSVKGDGNLVEYIELNGVIVANGQDYTDNKYVRTNYITVEPNQTYYIKLPTNALYENCIVYFYNSNKSYLGYKSGLTSEFTTVANTKFIRIDMKKADDTINTQEDVNNCDFVVSKCRVTEYVPRLSDKKRLLYYNNETQTWEKPILREWDSIEKHADGKYYYHQRSGEVVLNGSEDWTFGPGHSDITTSLFYYRINDRTPNSECICDKFTRINGYTVDYPEGVYYGADINIRISTSKLSTQDVEGFKQWLQANNVTVVYQLAEEKVYECTNIDLITYANETNYLVESGVLSPKTTLKVHNNISNVVSLLQKKVSLLEAELYNYKVNQNLRQLRTFYKSDYANFGVATLNNYSVEPTSIAITPYGYDLFEIFKEVIAQGKDKYDRIELEEYIDFYLMTFVFDFDMVFELFDLLDANEDIIEDEPVEEESPMEEEEEIVEDTPTILPLLPEDEEVVEDTPTILPILPEDEATIIPLI